MDLPATKGNEEGCRGRWVLSLPSSVARVKSLPEEKHIRRVAVVSPLPDDGSSRVPDDLAERAQRVTTLLEEILSRSHGVPHGGINE